MKTTHKLVLLAFIASMGFIVYSITAGGPDVSPCDNSQRYNDETAGGGLEVPVADLKPKVLAYRESHINEKTPYKTTGFLLSKRIIDELFKNATDNVLLLDL